MRYHLTKLKFKKNILFVHVRDTQGKGGVFRVALRYRTRLSSEMHQFLFDGESESGVYHGKLDLSKCRLIPIYYDLVVLEEAQPETAQGSYVHVAGLRNLLRFPLYDGKYTAAQGMFMHPYITPESGTAFQYRERTKADTVAFRMQEALILAWYLLTKPYWRHRKIYLVYEKFCMMAQDNGYYFFEYCMKHDVERRLNAEIYYVIDPNAADMEKLEPYREHVIPFLSLRHKLYLLACRLLISTDTRKHAYAWRKRMSFIDHCLRSKPVVFLQHGVTAFKKVDQLYGKGGPGGCRVFVVTSDYEREIVERYFGYTGDEIAVTGFARWDVLRDRSQEIPAGSEDENMILVMPTWRNWLEEVDEETFRASAYYRTYMELLQGKRLGTLLEEKNLHLCFYIHPKFRQYLQDFSAGTDRIRMVPFGTEPLNELMMRCRMLVTDYSSVAWDVYYQKKPVVFFQFDLKDYLEAHGSYMDMDKELFGPVEKDCGGLLAQIARCAERQFRLEERYEAMHDRYFKYVDQDNAGRIVEHIRAIEE